VHCHVCCEHFASDLIANLHWGSGRSTGAPSYRARHLDPSDVAALRQDKRGVWHKASDKRAERDGARRDAPERTSQHTPRSGDNR
jgi:hypothetical protein